MMRTLIISDSHGRCDELEKVLAHVKPIDLLIHLGDFEGDEEYIEAIAGCPVEMVSGNNDYFSKQPREKFLEIGKHYVMLTHGHRHGVNYGVDQIKEAAFLQGADIVMFGHTHCPLIDLSNDDIWAINPGSISLPRQSGRIPTFIIMETDNEDELHFALNYTNAY